MPISDAASKAGGVLNDLKSRLGFGRNDDGYDDYDDYDDYEDEYDDYDDDYDEQGDADYGYSASAGGSSAYRATSTRTSRYGRTDSGPNLVSIDDVKARTQVPDTLMRDPLDTTSDTRMTRRNGRNFVENGGPAESSPAYNAARARERELERETRSKSDGLNSLFEPSTGSSKAYDPYEAYSSKSPTGFTTTRGLTVVKPMSYSDVERVSRAVKAGDVVVLSLRSTPDDLSKRVLDFTFGVASALDANVECPSSKVFAVARGRALSEDEKSQLRSQGVL